LEKNGAIRYFGYIEQAYLPLVYSAARVLLFPSLYEGFGLPVLEAMQSGTAVMTSENSSMSEVAGEAALLINPLDIDNMIESIKRLHNDDAYVKELVVRSIKQSSKFSWHKCVEKTISLYKKILTET
jgi:glycosyltransferase involved in cell wall biosynthesis